ncbi:MAG: acetyl-CoA C-acyltransferase [Austwickia sp.]|jgi:acetyl-CoA C-acetyltransferase|nr:acetyl-CoA C-acyltransferase [Austwickia sp.]MBK8435148.1 acetyl-CoA C-acyltransferase [Austwickia sp.]MBK9101298.1 acetyl-CoA C-acyltransferase [Austwickia sp.]
MPEAVIVAIGRSPIGRAVKGSLVDERPDNLGAYVLDKVLEQVPQLDRASIDDVIAGCALPGGEQAHNLGRIVSLLARVNAPGSTVNRYCSSSLQAVRMAFHAIKAGEGDAFAAVGIESVTHSPLGVYADQPETHNVRMDPGNSEGLPEAYLPMGETAERVADQENISREDMDRLAVQSHARAIAAQQAGKIAPEIIPIPVYGGKVVTSDDGPREGVTMESLAGLRPVFRRKGGRVTAGNSCPLNDGAAAAVIMSDTRAKELGITPLARILSTGVSSLAPEMMGLGPIESSKQALARAGLSIDDVDIVEINEAFAAQVIPSALHLGVDPFSEKLNPLGGAIALGHPFGMTGVRILTTLLNGLRQTDTTIGLETMCVGGGQGMAIVVERLS